MKQLLTRTRSGDEEIIANFPQWFFCYLLSQNNVAVVGILFVYELALTGYLVLR